MSKSFRIAWFAAILVCGVALATHAAPFEPLFRIIRVSGQCTVLPPGASAFSDAIDGKAYPYGTKVVTGRDSSLVVEFSIGNECRVMSGATLTVAEDTADRGLKLIKLDAGKVEVVLDEEALTGGDGLNVETCCAVCGAIAGNFTVESRTEPELATTVFLVKKGSIKVYGPQFDVPGLDEDDVLFVSCALDRSFTRLRNVQGQFPLTFRGSKGQQQRVDMQKDEVVKIWRKGTESGDETVITIIVAGPDGNLRDAHTYTIEGGLAGAPLVTTPPTQPTASRTKTTSSGGTKGGVQAPNPPAFESRVSSTTTTIPPGLQERTPTPVGFQY